MAAGTPDESLHPIAVLIDELRDEDIALKLNSIRRLSTIALALGEERTRAELIPYLAETKQDDDEVLVALAEEVGKLVPYIGGVKYAECLIPLLEELARTEETVVRDEAVNSMNIVGKDLSERQMADTFIPALKKLACGEWFTCRVSACGLFAAAYSKANTATRGDLRALFKQLCRDDTPMVRRAAAAQLGKLAAVSEPENVSQGILPLYSALIKDDQESVRKLAFESTAAFVTALQDGAPGASGAQSLREALDVMQPILKDSSWRVRHCVAQQFPAIATAFGTTMTREQLVTPFAALLQDPEPEVRVTAAENLAKFCGHLTEPLITTAILPHLRTLVGDTSQYVRTAVASVVMELSPMLGKAGTVTHLLDLYLKLLKDRCPEVRLNVLSTLQHASTVMGSEHLTESLLPAIEELATDKSWRVRHAIIEKLPVLAEQMGVEFYQDKLLPQNRKWLHDRVASIRMAATVAIVDVARVFGIAWARDHAVGEILAQLTEPFYLQRITVLQAAALLAEVISPDVLRDKLLPALLKQASDRVPNVKFNVCKVLVRLAPLIDQSTADSQVVPVLNVLLEDPDFDVRFFAQQGLDVYTSSAVGSKL